MIRVYLRKVNRDRSKNGICRSLLVGPDIRLVITSRRLESLNVVKTLACPVFGDLLVRTGFVKPSLVVCQFAELHVKGNPADDRHHGENGQRDLKSDRLV